MRAMVLNGPGQPLQLKQLATPSPGEGEVLVQTEACAVCRTDLHIVDGELPGAHYPIVPGHQVVGRIAASGDTDFRVGARVGIPWLGATCGECDFCRRDRENLCDAARFTGFDRDGGYAEFLCADGRFCLPMDSGADPVVVAPLLCAGLIGYRALGMTGDAHHVGLYGFGAAAHILAQVLRHQRRSFSAFTRPGDVEAQRFAGELGAHWAGGSDEAPPDPLDAAIIFAPVGALLPTALQHVRKGGVVVCGGIHMSDIPSFPYRHLWGERVVRSVANLTRRDGEEFLRLAAEIPISANVKGYRLEEANDALDDLRGGRLTGSAVLVL